MDLDAPVAQLCVFCPSIHAASCLLVVGAGDGSAWLTLRPECGGSISPALKLESLLHLGVEREALCDLDAHNIILSLYLWGGGHFGKA